MVRVQDTEISPVAASGNNTLTLPNDGTIISKDSNGVVGVTSTTQLELELRLVMVGGLLNGDGLTQPMEISLQC